MYFCLREARWIFPLASRKDSEQDDYEPRNASSIGELLLYYSGCLKNERKIVEDGSVFDRGHVRYQSQRSLSDTPGNHDHSKIQ